MQLELCWAWGGGSGVCPPEKCSLSSWQEHLTNEHTVAGSLPIDYTALFYFRAITHSYNLRVVSLFKADALSQGWLEEASPVHQFNSIIKIKTMGHGCPLEKQGRLCIQIEPHNRKRP